MPRREYAFVLIYNWFCFALLYDAQKCEKRRSGRFYELPIEFTKSHWDWEICHKTATNLELNNEFCSIISFNCDTRKIMNYYLKAFIFLSGCIYLYFYFSIWIMWYAMCTFLSSKVLWFTNNYDYYIVPNKFWPPLKTSSRHESPLWISYLPAKQQTALSSPAGLLTIYILLSQITTFYSHFRPDLSPPQLLEWTRPTELRQTPLGNSR